MLSLSPHERVNKLLEQKYQEQPVLTLKFQVLNGMKLVKEHAEIAVANLGINTGPDDRIKLCKV